MTKVSKNTILGYNKCSELIPKFVNILDSFYHKDELIVLESVSKSFSDLPSATAYWTAASSKPSNNDEIYIKDLEEFWNWNHLLDAKAEFSRYPPILSYTETTKNIKNTLVGIETPTGTVLTEKFGVDTLPVISATASSRAYFLEDAIPFTGVINNLEIYASANQTLKIKRYKIVDLSYEFQDEISVALVTGLNDVVIPDFAVDKGDILSFYSPVSYYLQADNSFGGVAAKSGYLDNVEDVVISTLGASPSSLLFKLTISYEELAYSGGLLDGYFASATAPELSDIIKIPVTGQSLSANVNAGPSTFSAPVENALDVNGNNTNLQDMNGGIVEMFKKMAVENAMPLADDFKIMTSVNGSDGKTILELSKGSSYFTALINNVIAGKAYADSIGKTFSVPGIAYFQGEAQYYCDNNDADYGSGDWNPFNYSPLMIKMIDDYNEAILPITGQKFPVKLYIYQIASHNAYHRYPRIALEQLQAAITDDRIVLSKVMYDVDYNSDGAHAPAKTYRNMGNFIGIDVFKDHVLKEKVLPIFPVSHELIGTDLYIQFKTEKALEFDTFNVAALADGNFGFNLLNVQNETNGASGTVAASTVSITAVGLVADNVVKISFDAVPPTGHRLTYGVNGTGWNYINGSGVDGVSGRTAGARGNLRSKETRLNKVDDYLLLQKWCPIFEIIL